MAFEKHRWADFLRDIPADPAMGMGSGSFPMPLELRQSIAVHLENLGFTLVKPQMVYLEPSGDMMGEYGWRATDGD